MIKDIIFLPGHLDFMEPRECFRDDDALKNRFNEMWGSDNTEMRTILWNNRPIAVFALLVTGKVGDYMAITTNAINECKEEFHKHTVDMMEYRWKKHDLVRMQMVVRSDFEVGCRWTERLGLKREALLRKIGPEGADYYMYARIKE